MNTTTSHITINAPAAKVWDALTKPALIKQWQYGSDVITDWQPGSPIAFNSKWEGQIYKQWGTILKYAPPKQLSYSLFAPRPDLEDKPENYFTMTYSLEETDGRTTVTITQDDPREQPAQAEADEQENSVLTSLKQLVEGSLAE
jgi:uncharacterized protein YndB with AHSA1/START domain